MNCTARLLRNRTSGLNLFAGTVAVLLAVLTVDTTRAQTVQGTHLELYSSSPTVRYGTGASNLYLQQYYGNDSILREYFHDGTNYFFVSEKTKNYVAIGPKVGLGMNPTTGSARLTLQQMYDNASEGLEFVRGEYKWNLFADANGERFVIAGNNDATKGIVIRNGNVGIGTGAPFAGYKLTVDGTVGARKLKITQAPGWADFVFDPAYRLPSLQEVEQFVKTNRRLPDIPSEQQVMAEGIDVGEINRKLLQKVEELTLYLIEQDKQLKQIKAELSVLKKNGQRWREK